jgi:preprotein translocase SecE subunit
MNSIIKLPKSIWNYFRDVAAELKAMEWLSFSNVAQSTVVVIVITVLVVLIVSGMDAVFVAGRSLLLNRF